MVPALEHATLVASDGNVDDRPVAKDCQAPVRHHLYLGHRLESSIVDVAVRDPAEVLLPRPHPAARIDELEVGCVQSVDVGDAAFDESAKAPLLDVA
jgi:hypothetical protein